MDFFTAERYLEFIAIGLGIGTYGTLIGAGGGFVLMPMPILFFPKERVTPLPATILEEFNEYQRKNGLRQTDQ